MKNNKLITILSMVLILPVLTFCSGPAEESSSSSTTSEKKHVTDNSLKSDIARVGSYLNKVPYLTYSSPSSQPLHRNAIKTDEYETDEDGYYNITNPSSRYLSDQKFGYYISTINESYNDNLSRAHSLKNEAIRACDALNKWCEGERNNEYMILYDFVTENLTFYEKALQHIVVSTGEEYDSETFYKCNIFRDEEDKLNYTFSEVFARFDKEYADPIYYQNNVSYKEGEYYYYNYVMREYQMWNAYPVDQDETLYNQIICSEVLRTYYIDFSKPDLLFAFTNSYSYTPENRILSSVVEKTIYDLDKRIELYYPKGGGESYSLFDEDGHTVLVYRYDSKYTYFNLYEFTGWDYFYTESFDNWQDNHFKFKLTNNNINGSEYTLGIIYSSAALNGYELYSGYPYVQTDTDDYEDFISFLNDTELKYVGDEKDFETLEAYMNDELRYEVFSYDFVTIPDEIVKKCVLEHCDNYKYSDIEEFMNTEREVVPLSNNKLEYMFNVNNQVVLEGNTFKLSNLDIDIKDNIFLTKGMEYKAFICYEYEDGTHFVLCETKFVYGEDSKLVFEDADVLDWYLNEAGEYEIVLMAFGSAQTINLE